MVINMLQDIIKLALLKWWIKQDLEQQLNILNSLSGNTTNDLANTMWKTADVMSQIVSIQPLWMQLLGTIGSIVAISSFILYIILLFRPGNPETNEYGENPKNVKVWFFG